MDDRGALTSAEAVMLDGANGVTGAPRAHFPGATAMVVLSLAVVLASRLAFARKAPWLIGLIAVCAALPGAWEVLVRRADAPLERPRSAATIEQSLDTLSTVAPWPGTSVQVEDDDVVFPLGRYALPSRRPLDGGAVLELTGDGLRLSCEVSGSTVRCRGER